MSSTPVSRRCLLATIFGSKLESQSRGTLMSTGPVSGDHRLGAAPVAGIPAVAALRVMLSVTQVVIQLAFQRALDDHLRQLAEQAALAGQLQPTGAGPLGELPQQLLIGGRQIRLVLAPVRRHVSHLVSLPFLELHR